MNNDCIRNRSSNGSRFSLVLEIAEGSLDNAGRFDSHHMNATTQQTKS